MNEVRESQVFSYVAPWLIYSLGFSCKPNNLYMIAVGSFLEEIENQVYYLFLLFLHFYISICKPINNLILSKKLSSLYIDFNFYSLGRNNSVK